MIDPATLDALTRAAYHRGHKNGYIKALRDTAEDYRIVAAAEGNDPERLKVARALDHRAEAFLKLGTPNPNGD